MAETATVEQVSTDNNQERTFTQAELDSIIKGRVEKERAKYSDYDTLKEKAAKFDEAEEAQKSELQKATERADALQSKLDELTRDNEVRTIREKVANDTGVPVALLTGVSEDDCMAQAQGILAFAKPQSYPSVKDSGEVMKTVTKQSNRDLFASLLNSALNNN